MSLDLALLRRWQCDHCMVESELQDVIAALERAERVEAALVELMRRAGDPDIVANAMGAGIMLASALRGAEAALEHPEE